MGVVVNGNLLRPLELIRPFGFLVIKNFYRFMSLPLNVMFYMSKELYFSRLMSFSHGFMDNLLLHKF